jgi:hypothetical protein
VLRDEARQEVKRESLCCLCQASKKMQECVPSKSETRSLIAYSADIVPRCVRWLGLGSSPVVLLWGREGMPRLWRGSEDSEEQPAKCVPRCALGGLAGVGWPWGGWSWSREAVSKEKK